MDDPIKDNDYRICNELIESYHYNIPKSRKGVVFPVLTKYTPNKQNTMQVSKYEGKYHPSCKIKVPGYENYNTSENQIFYRDQVIFDINSPDIKNIDLVLLNVFITCQFHSLVLRLNHDIVLRDGNVDKGHINAGLYSVNNIFKSLRFLYNNSTHPEFSCIDDDLYKTFGSLELIEKIYVSLKGGGNKENIMALYEQYKSTITTISQNTISQSTISQSTKNTTSKARKLF